MESHDLVTRDTLLHLCDQSPLAVVDEPRQDFAVGTALLLFQDDPIPRLVKMPQQEIFEFLAPLSVGLISILEAAIWIYQYLRSK